jgi:hypothetical protein
MKAQALAEITEIESAIYRSGRPPSRNSRRQCPSGTIGAQAFRFREPPTERRFPIHSNVVLLAHEPSSSMADASKALSMGMIFEMLNGFFLLLTV